MAELRHLVPLLAARGARRERAGRGTPRRRRWTTVAGAGRRGPPRRLRGRRRPATATDADFNRPAQVAALPGGGYLIADSSNQRIRRVAADGTLSTVAGDGNQCSGPTERCGDGGDPLAASLNTPHDVAVLPDGAILIADTFDNRIREVSPDGHRITTVAGTGDSCTPALDPCGHGGPAVDAQLSLPLAVDPLPDGDFLVADQGQIAGAPDQKLSRVRLVHDGRMLLLAGSGGWAFGGDDGPALDASFDALPTSSRSPTGACSSATAATAACAGSTRRDDPPAGRLRGVEHAGELHQLHRLGRRRRRRPCARRVVQWHRLRRAGRRRHRVRGRHLQQPHPEHRARRHDLHVGRHRGAAELQRRVRPCRPDAARVAERDLARRADPRSATPATTACGVSRRARPRRPCLRPGSRACGRRPTCPLWATSTQPGRRPPRCGAQPSRAGARAPGTSASTAGRPRRSCSPTGPTASWRCRSRRHPGRASSATLRSPPRRASRRARTGRSPSSAR